jgi:hypothetical protein
VPGGTGEHQKDDIGAVTDLHKKINAKLIAYKNILNEISLNEQSSNSYHSGLADTKAILTQLSLRIG